MTTIGTAIGMMSSPRAMMDKRIDAAVEAGSISATDQAALETALDAIDSSLSSSSSGTARLDPSAMKDRIDSLISDQVTNGTLTEDQAAELQSFFAQGGPPPAGGEGDMSVDGMGDMASVDGMRGPPPPPPPSSSDDDSDSSTTEQTTADQLDAIIAFLQNLRNSMASSTYGTSTSASDNSNAGLVVDSLA